MPNTAPLPGSTIERLFDAIDMPIGCWDAQHRLCACNATYLRWAGQSRAQLLGRTLAELYGNDAWAAARDAFGEALTGREASYERLLTHRDGAPRWMRVKVFPEIRPDGSVASVYTVAVDIHDDVTQREVLQAAQRRLDRFTDNIPYPLTYVDRDFTIRFVNKAYCAATGMAAEALVGRHIGEVRGSRRWEEHRPYFERALAGESVQYTRLAELGTSGQRWLRTSYEPDRGVDGEVLGLYTVSIDVHEMTLVQERLRRRVERDALTQVLSRRALIERIDAALPGAAKRRWRCSSSTWTASRRSTTRSATAKGTACWPLWPLHCKPHCAPKTASAASAATSSSCWRGFTTGPAPTRWPSICCRPCNCATPALQARRRSARASATPSHQPTPIRPGS